MTNEYEAVVGRLAALYGLPGVSYAVGTAQDELHFGWTGLASPAFNVPVGATTLFHAGSLAKQMTAVAVLRSAEAGLLDVERPVGAYVPDIPPGWRDIPLTALLSHASGIPNYTDHIDQDLGVDNAAIYRQIAHHPMLFAAGDNWNYSNTNYRLLGDVIERVCQGGYATVMQELFDAAGLTSARLDNPAAFHERAEPCDVDGQRLRRSTVFYGINLGSADGGVAMTALDALRWGQALWSGTLLDGESMTRFVAPLRLASGRTFPYAAGLWCDHASSGVPSYWHGGAMPGFSACAIWLPASGLGVAVLANALPLFAAARHIALTLAEIAVPRSTPLSLSALEHQGRSNAVDCARILFRGEEHVDQAWLARELPIPGDAPRPAEYLNLSACGRPDAVTAIERWQEGDGWATRYRVAWGAKLDFVVVGRTADGAVWRVARS